MRKVDVQGGARVSPWTGEVFTGEFAFRNHLARWPEICAANGCGLDGKPAPAPAPEPIPVGKPKAKKR